MPKFLSELLATIEQYRICFNRNAMVVKGICSCKWVQKSLFFFSLFFMIPYAFRNTHVKFQAGIRKIVEVMKFFCHVMFDLRFLELKTLNAFFSKPCFSNWRAR